MNDEQVETAEKATAEEAATDTTAADATETEGLSLEEEMVEVKVTKEMLDENPELVTQGLTEGDLIKVAKKPSEEGESGVIE